MTNEGDATLVKFAFMDGGNTLSGSDSQMHSLTLNFANADHLLQE